MEDTQYNNRRSRSRKRRRKRKSCVFFKTFITVFAIFSLFLIGSRVLTPWFSGELTTEQMDGVGDNFSSIPETVQPDTSIVPQMAEIDLENLYSPYAILVDLDSGTVLKEKNSTDRIYPASLTKIMTAILAIENTEDLEEIVQLPDEIFPPLYAQNASMAGFQPGEEVRLKDLLYGVLIPSGAECCLAFADRISGSEEEFVSLMNDKAQELGMKNTHFTNSTGLHDPEHYSTVEDISILLQYATAQDVLVVIGYPKYTKFTLQILDFLKELGCKTISITDAITSPLAKRSDYVIVAKNRLKIYFVTTITILNTLLVMISRTNPEAHIRLFEEENAVTKKLDVYSDD